MTTFEMYGAPPSGLSGVEVFVWGPSDDQA
jgi:hypothetical protein